ncbi:MAG: winged helix-turn-helix domain-containing protein [Thermofilaceae archaeon]
MCSSGEEELRDWVRVLRTLANPIRLRMLALIAARPRHAYELSKLLGLSYPLVHMHLRALEKAGLVEGAYVEEARVKRVYRLKDFRLVLDGETLRKLGEKLEDG